MTFAFKMTAAKLRVSCDAGKLNLISLRKYSTMSSEDQSPNLLRSASVYGLYLGLLLILIQVIQYLSDIYVSAMFSMITGVATIVILVLIIKNYRESKLNGWLTYGQGVGIGTLSAIFAGLLLGGFMLVLVTLIDKEYTEKFLMQLEDTLIQAKYPEDKLDEYMDTQRENINRASFAYGPILQFGIGGLIVSLIAALFLRKTSETTFEKDTI